VQKVVPEDELLDQALRIADAICRGGRNAVPMIKEVATKGLQLPLSEALWLEQVYFQRNREEAIDEIEERLRAFQERSKKGKK
jgi:enoyl-CoA hydratase/carnithine racemase